MPDLGEGPLGRLSRLEGILEEWLAEKIERRAWLTQEIARRTREGLTCRELSVEFHDITQEIDRLEHALGKY